MFEADIQKAIDRQLEIERKAAAWDKVREFSQGDPTAQLDGAHFVAWLDGIWGAVHPAQTLSTR